MEQFLALCLLYILSAIRETIAFAPAIQWVDCHKKENVPVSLPLLFPNADTTKLPLTLQCGRIVVPMDYEKAIGPDNNITLGLAMYTPKQPKGVIF